MFPTHPGSIRYICCVHQLHMMAFVINGCCIEKQNTAQYAGMQGNSKAIFGLSVQNACSAETSKAISSS